MGFDYADTSATYERLRAREKARVQAQQVKDGGLPTMTPLAIREAALDDEGYETPELNERLYLHFRGYRRIENLEPYTSIKALWLGSNGLTRIEGIGHMAQLRCLFVQQNLIQQLSGLEGLDNLVQLDISQNRISHIQGLSHLKALHTLNINKNALQDAGSIAHLQDCASLTNIDVSGNSLAGEDVLTTLKGIPELIALTCTGNPFLTQIPHFRKTAITSMPKLRYLDRPIFELERLGSEAWLKGGPEAEVEARKEYQEAKRRGEREHMAEFRQWQKDIRQKKMEEIAQRRAAGLPDLPDPSEEQRAMLAERMAKARADAEAEKAIIQEVGIAKLGSRFWANGAGGGGDVYEDIRAAGEQEINRKAREQELEAEMVASAAADAAAVQDVVASLPKVSNTVEPLDETVSCVESTTPMVEEVSSVPVVVSAYAAEETETQAAKAKECDAAQEEVEVVRARQQEKERVARIAESLKLYREQQAKKDELPQFVAPAPTPIHSTTSASTASEVRWTEAIDTQLAGCVYRSAFDFDATAVSLRSLFPSDSAWITSTSCRLRWTALDVEDDVSSESDTSDTEHTRRNITPTSHKDVLPSPPHSVASSLGVLPPVVVVPPSPPTEDSLRLANAAAAVSNLSFEELMQRAAQQPSKYLERPPCLPSVDNASSDEESESESGVAVVKSIDEIKLKLANARGGAKRAPSASVARAVWAGDAHVAQSTAVDASVHVDNAYEELD